MRLVRFAVPVALALAFAAGCASTTSASAPAAAPQPGAWSGSGIAKKLVIVGINDTHGALNSSPTAMKSLQKLGIGDVGGADWFGGWMNAVRADASAKDADMIILDGGDMFQGSLISNQFLGASVVDAYNQIGVTAAAVGNHEFDFGIPALKARIAQAHFPILAANIFIKGTEKRPDWATPTAIIHAAGTKVGIIGLSTVETPLTTNPVNVADLEFRPGGPIAAKLADELRADGCTIVLITAHMGTRNDGEIQQVAIAVQSKVDAIVSGHHHLEIGPPPLIVDNIPIVQSGHNLVAFSTIELTLNSKTGRTVSYAVNDGNWPKPGGPQALIHALDGQPPTYRGQVVTPDAKVAAILKGYDDQVAKQRETVIGSTEVALEKGGDELLANLCADSLRSGAGGSLKADFAFQNGGGIRIPEIAAGPIKFGQIFDLYPFDNSQIVLNVPMATVRDALEAIIRAGKSSMKVSGLRYTIDWDKFGAAKDLRKAPPGALVVEVDDEQGQPLCVTKSCTETACTSECKPGNFKLSVTDFLANGGDGLTLLKDLPRTVGPVLARDSIVGFVKEHSPLTAKLLGASSAGAPPRVTTIGSSPTP